MTNNAFTKRLDVRVDIPNQPIRRAFTLLELLMVITIIGILMSFMGVMITNSFRKAREAATTTLILKIDGLLDERWKGFDRATKAQDFHNYVTARTAALQTNGIYGVSPKVIEAVARKDFFRQNFPQRWEDLANYSGLGDGEDLNMNGVLDAGEDKNNDGTLNGTNGVPDIIEAQVNGIILAKLQPQGLAEPGNPVSGAALQRHETESAELLYFSMTHMQAFGVPPIGEAEFSTSEVADTDGDGLLEFVDAWGRPLRFYRWPTRLLKPNGIVGADNQPGVAGVDDDLNGTIDGSGTTYSTYDLFELSKVNSDDVNIPSGIRSIAAMLIDGLPGSAALPGQWDTLSADPDDPYGLISTEIKRLFATGTNVMVGVAAYNEPTYPTLDTYHTPLIVSLGPDGDLGLFEPFAAGIDANGDGIPDDGVGVLAQPIHGSAGPYDIANGVTPLGNNVISAFTDNITNRNRRAGRGK